MGVGRITLDSAIPQMPVDRCPSCAEQIHCFQPPKCCARVGDYSNSPQTHLDRLLHRCVVLTLAGDSYRLRDHRDEPEAVGHPWCRGQPGPDAQRDC